jgi:cell division protease FtsH
MASALGGRSAEELVFGEITTGAANDIEKCTEIAKAMVTQYGMSAVLGPRKFGQEPGEVFLGRDQGHQRDYSDDVASQIDDEVNMLIEQAHDEAVAILVAHRATLDALADALVEHETVDDSQLAELFKDMEKWQGPPARDERPEPGPIQPQTVIPVPVSDPIPTPVAPVTPLRRLGRAWRRAPRPSSP